jgi:hypothetical protein
MTAPPNFEWSVRPVEFSARRGAFSDPGEVSGEVAVADPDEMEMANLFPDPRSKEELMRQFEDWYL